MNLHERVVVCFVKKEGNTRERERGKKKKLDEQDLFSFKGGSVVGGEEGGRGGISRIRAEQSPLRGAE